MVSSFICEKCGIKVSGEEGLTCPGCGHQANPEANFGTQNNPVGSSASSDALSPLRSRVSEEWSLGFLRECESLFDPTIPIPEQVDAIQEVITRISAKVREAPDAESANRLYSFLGEMHRTLGQYQEAYEFGAKGVASTLRYFNHQSHNTILDAICNLDLLDEFEGRLQSAIKDGFPDVSYHQMNYYLRVGRYDEAIRASDDCYSSNVGAMNYSRAMILVSANRLEEAESLFVKVIASGRKEANYPNSINSLVYSVLIPQGRYVEAERYLARALCTENERERVNAYSNLAMVALHFKEYGAAKRYASVAADYRDRPIASESRLTICRIESKRLLDNESTTVAEWKELFEEIHRCIQISDLDDVDDFFELLVEVAGRTEQAERLVEIIEAEYEGLKASIDWKRSPEKRERVELVRIVALSRYHLDKTNYRELDSLFMKAIDEFPDRNFTSLIDYLRTPFAGIDLRRVALKNTNIDFATLWASFESNPEILFSLAKFKERSVFLALAHNPASPDEVCELIAKQQDLDLDFALSTRSELSPALRETLVKSKFDSVRKEMAKRSGLSDEMYRTLATDSAVLVRNAIRENQDCSVEIRALAALGSL